MDISGWGTVDNMIQRVCDSKVTSAVSFSMTIQGHYMKSWINLIHLCCLTVAVMLNHILGN